MPQTPPQTDPYASYAAQAPSDPYASYALQGGGVPSAHTSPPETLPRIGSLWDSVKAAGSELGSMVSGPYHALTDAPQNAGEKTADAAMGAPGRAMYRMFAEPTIRALSHVSASPWTGPSYDAKGNYTPTKEDDLMDAIPMVGPVARNVENVAATKGAGPAVATLGMDLLPAVAGDALPKLGEMVPTRAKAGKLFDEVQTAAAGQPVNLTRSLPLIERAQQLSARGHGTIAPIDSLYNRINTVNPLDYVEARDRASALGNLTASDKMNATKSLQSQAKRLSHAFGQDIGDTADAVGKGDQYRKAMDTYRRAAQYRDVAGKVGKYVALPAGAAVAGTVGAHELMPILKSLFF